MVVHTITDQRVGYTEKREAVGDSERQILPSFIRMARFGIQGPERD